MVGAEKTMVQKSGYFSRSAAANDEDLALIRACADLAVDAALRGESGVVGQDEEAGDVLRVCRVPADQGRQGVRPERPVVPRPARRDRPAAALEVRRR